MNKTRLITSILFVTLFVTSTFFVAHADEEGFQYSESNGNVTITIDDVTIKVNAGGQVPKFHYQIEDGLNYTIMFKQIMEFNDSNADGAFQYNETAYSSGEYPGQKKTNILALPSVVWAFSGFENETEGDTVTAIHFNFTSTEILHPDYADLELVIVAHMYLNDQEINGYEISGGTELKFDLIIRNWPWDLDTNNLAVRFDISTDEDDEVHPGNGKPVDTGSNTTGEEKKVEHQNGAKANFSIGDQGYFGYANQSQNKNNGKYEDKPVNASYSADGAGNVQVFLAFEYFETELVYDPSIGATLETEIDDDVTDDEEEEISPTGSITLLIAAMSSIAVVAVLAKSRNKKI